MSNFPPIFSVTRCGNIEKMNPAEFDGDPRGIFWMWEPPNPNNTYIMGIDPTVGRTGWNRYARVKEDAKTDNGAIEIIKVGKGTNSVGFPNPDVQVAEFAAPVDSTELGDYANLFGRLYSGKDEDQCKCIIEVYPGPGGMTLQRMLALGYTNHFRWEYYAGSVATPTKSIGWNASPKTNRDLWLKASRHINLDRARIRSPFLTEEYADCQMNLEKQWAENPGGHDDRVRAFNLAIWVANGWSMDIERTTETVQVGNSPVNFAQTDMDIDDIHDAWGNILDSMMG